MIEERARDIVSKYAPEGPSLFLRGIVEEAIRAAVEECAKVIEDMWTPSVGGYPSGSELAAAVRAVEVK